MTFGGNPLDRASARRGDSGWLAAQARGGLHLPFWQNKPLVRNGACRVPALARCMGGRTVGLPGAGRGPRLVRAGAGRRNPAAGGRACSRRCGPPPSSCPRATRHRGPGQGAAGLASPPRLLPQLRRGDGDARGRLAARLPPMRGGAFPRTDPVVIMLPVFEDHCLMGRNARFPGRFIRLLPVSSNRAKPWKKRCCASFQKKPHRRQRGALSRQPALAVSVQPDAGLLCRCGQPRLPD